MRVVYVVTVGAYMRVTETRAAATKEVLGAVAQYADPPAFLLGRLEKWEQGGDVKFLFKSKVTYKTTGGLEGDVFVNITPSELV